MASKEQHIEMVAGNVYVQKTGHERQGEGNLGAFTRLSCPERAKDTNNEPLTTFPINDAAISTGPGSGGGGTKLKEQSCGNHYLRKKGLIRISPASYPKP